MLKSILDSTVISVNWCVIEVGTAITCTSLSSLRPLLAKLLPKFFTHISINASVSKRISVLPSRGKSLKLSNVSHTHSRSASVAWNHGENERGEIVVEQTFDVREEWEGVKDKKDEVGRSTGKSDKMGKKADSRIKELANSSEEELVVPKEAPSTGRTRW